MATVINAVELKRAFVALGWDDVNLAAAQEWLKESGISPEEVLSFCNQLIAHPEGLDTTDFADPVNQTDLPYIVEYFQGLGVVY